MSLADTTHQVAIATLQSLVLMREQYVNLHGMPVAHYRPYAQDLSRADQYGDIRHDLQFEQVLGFKLVIDIPAMFRRVHHMVAGSDEWATYKIRGECSLNAQISEGDVIGLYNRYLLSDSQSTLGSEYKYLQVVRVDQGIHYRPISKIVSLVTYRDQNIDQTQSPAFIDVLHDSLGAWVQPSVLYLGTADGTPVLPVADASGNGYVLSYPDSPAPVCITVNGIYRILQCTPSAPLVVDLTKGGTQPAYAQATVIEVLPAGIVVNTYTDYASYTCTQSMYGALIIDRYLTQSELDNVVAVFSDYSPAAMILNTGEAIVLADGVSTILP